MPRDFRIDRCRPPCSPGGELRSRIHVSISDDTPTSTSCDAPLPGMRWVNSAVMFLPFEEVDQPHHHAVDFVERRAGETRQRIDDDDRRFRLVDLAMHRREVELEPVQRRPRRMDLEQALLDPAIEVRGRPTACCARTAPAIPRTESRRRARRGGRPHRGNRRRGSSLPFRRRPRAARCSRESIPCRRTSRRASRVRSRSARTSPCGSTAARSPAAPRCPRRSIRNGYSFVPWLEPRYFTMRRRRVEI